MDKSYVTMEQKQCPICGTIEDCGSILMDTRIVKGKTRKTFEPKTLTGYGLCKEHKKMFDDGFLACIEVTSNTQRTTIKMENANRTGNIIHIKREAANNIFNTEIEPHIEMIFIQPGVIEKIQKMTQGE
ncbi:hypothetical protein UFOVP1138_63 [uncultured Caudovirales phage]|uniref:Uncharacterized protein n=1 Tax=uncultured Caudovirales phage TaxID=2100421 RepID=A0A6J5R079_9CAUD|nr:hypothetical protein UFOVP975_57 [uncultured Caudovirales phage]CAB4186295.1 hypothetical protein UFOVP1138_63 [uncultured Caudovirales phage]CAB4204440.1 hypothetical protein UFOVP1394_60 [uncultured Caudovirales phage]